MPPEWTSTFTNYRHADLNIFLNRGESKLSLGVIFIISSLDTRAEIVLAESRRAPSPEHFRILASACARKKNTRPTRHAGIESSSSDDGEYDFSGTSYEPWASSET
jgi:hypothetical protein